MEQAFCCALLSPLPDIREKYMNRFLMGSDLTATALFPEEDEEQEEDGTDCISVPAKVSGKPMPATLSHTGESGSSSSLFVRLMFLLISSPWDEAHFKDDYWLPIFFDVSCIADLLTFSSHAPPSGIGTHSAVNVIPFHISLAVAAFTFTSSAWWVDPRGTLGVR